MPDTYLSKYAGLVCPKNVAQVLVGHIINMCTYLFLLWATRSINGIFFAIPYKRIIAQDISFSITSV